MRRKRILIFTALVMCAAFLPASPAGAAAFCAGDGQSGERFQAVYARAASQPADLALIAGMAGKIDDAFVASANRSSPGAAAHPRWACTGGVLSVIEVALPANWNGQHSTLKQAMQAHPGNLLDEADRKYVVWTGLDSDACLIGDLFDDDRPSPAENIHDTQTGGSTVAMIARNCWGDGNPPGTVSWGQQHEVMHTLGAVQESAPHAHFGHTYERYEAMTLSKDGVGVRCGTEGDFGSFAANQPLFDCGHDDYFSANPDCDNYLAKHWNTFNSSFVVRQGHPATRMCPIKGPAKTKDRTPTFTFFANRPVTGFMCALDGGPAAPCTSPFTTPKLKPGNHELQVIAAADFEGRPSTQPQTTTFKIKRRRR